MIEQTAAAQNIPAEVYQVAEHSSSADSPHDHYWFMSFAHADNQFTFLPASPEYSERVSQVLPPLPGDSSFVVKQRSVPVE
jgi:hypothetical protein